MNRRYFEQHYEHAQKVADHWRTHELCNNLNGHDVKKGKSVSGQLPQGSKKYACIRLLQQLANIQQRALKVDSQTLLLAKSMVSALKKWNAETDLEYYPDGKESEQGDPTPFSASLQRRKWTRNMRYDAELMAEKTAKTAATKTLTNTNFDGIVSRLTHSQSF